MKSRLILLLVALPAVLAGLLVAIPADAASHDAYLLSTTIVIHSDGTGRAAISCHSSHTCKGRLTFEGSTRYRDFKVPGKTTQYADVAVHASQGGGDSADPAYPHGGAGEGNRTAATLNVHETYPNDRSYKYNVHTETPVTSQTITGHINAHYPPGTAAGEKMKNLKIELLSELRGGNVRLLHTRSVTEGGTYTFSEPLGTNNHSSDPFELRISGTDREGNERSWYWRGLSNETTGGSRYIRKATDVKATSAGPFVADFDYGSITGTIRDEDFQVVDGADVTVAAPPPPGSNAAINRDLDIASCADVHARTTTAADGTYQADFLPFNPAGDKRYMVGVTTSARSTWNAAYGSCLDTIGYSANTRDNLIDLGADGLADETFRLRHGNTVEVDGHFSSAYDPTSQGDRWITVRERVPGLTVLEDPVVTAGPADSHGDRTITNLPPGSYTVELGRRTGCSDWYPSRFPNNSAYFKGLDRGAEAWKTVAGSKAEHAMSITMGFPKNGKKPPSGYKGWMYRDYCKAHGAGTINNMTVSGFNDEQNNDKDTSTDALGAVVKGHVSRTGGRTNKEMMVRLSSSKQTLVLRTDYTDGGGNFYVAGLASGTYTVSVNSDSWRGIGRTFTGKHTITVHAGHGYNLGTLTFHG